MRCGWGVARCFGERGPGATERGEPGAGPAGDRGAAREYLPAELSGAGRLHRACHT